LQCVDDLTETGRIAVFVFKARARQIGMIAEAEQRRDETLACSSRRKSALLV
jgi:hypothetical protein